MKPRIIPFPGGKKGEAEGVFVKKSPPATVKQGFGRSKKPNPTLAGLSPDLLRRIVKGARMEELGELFAHAETPFAEEAMTAPMVRILFWLLGEYRRNDNTLQVDMHGMYDSELVQAVIYGMLDPQLADLAGTEEYNIRPLILTHDFLRINDFVEEDTWTSTLTEAGRIYSTHMTAEGAWRDLFSFYRFNVGWLSLNKNYGKAPAELEVLQDSCYYSLYLLKGFEGCWLDPAELYEGMMNAFPLLRDYHEKPGEDLAWALYRSLFLWMFCEDLGLLEFEENDFNKRLLSGDRIRTTPLFKAALEWRQEP